MPTIRIFYSWQSDLPNADNRNYICRQLAKAKSAIENARPSLQLTIDDATRNEPGSPDIPTTILRKIREADVVVADITTTALATERNKACPNPNVLFELGYAVAHRGWDRIIGVFNEEYGTFPGDLPFDYQNHRFNPYRKCSGSSQATMPPDFVTWIECILDRPPADVHGDIGLAPTDAIKFQRDAHNIALLLSTIHIPTFIDFLNGLPHSFPDQIFFYWEGFRGLLDGGLFYLYDTELDNDVRQLATAWATTLSHPERYDSPHQGDIYIFNTPGDLIRPGAPESAWGRIDSARHSAHAAFQRILGRIRADYLDVDLLATSQTAIAEYSAFHGETRKHLETLP